MSKGVPMRFQGVVRAVCFIVLLADLACGSSASHPPDAAVPDAAVVPGGPSGLTYAAIAATLGVPIAPDVPTVTGTVTRWSVSPALPYGLTLSSNGVIHGTPIATSAPAAYTVTAADGDGSTTFPVQIAVAVKTPADACRDIPSVPAPSAVWPALQPAVTSDAAMEAQIAGIVEKMTLAQKVGQMVQGEIGNTSAADVATFFLGSMLNGGGSWPANARHAAAQDWRTMADAFFDASLSVDGVKIPVLWGIDALHGNNSVFGATVFPHNIGLGAAHDACLVEQIGAATAAQVRATGQDWAFGPTL